MVFPLGVNEPRCGGFQLAALEDQKLELRPWDVILTGFEVSLKEAQGWS
jgi:hypothetical protein